jgi:hypothetical protein
VKCKHCLSILDDSENAKDGLGYIRNGFARINDECDELEEKVSVIIGAIFKRHKYSVDCLLQSDHLTKIKSYAGKIKDDVERWEASNQLSFHNRLVYNENAQAIHDRVERIIAMIHQREPTLWEKIGGVFIRLWKLVIELLPLIVRKLLGGKKHKFVAKAA